MSLLNSVKKYRWYLLGRFKIKEQIKKKFPKEKLKIILGAGPTVYKGWISTDIPHFDILKEKDWEYLLGESKADNLLAEHVLEHLTLEQVIQVLALSYKYLKLEGCFRIAVPDTYHPDPEYIKLVAPPSQGHESAWNVDTLRKSLSDIGFQSDPLEYYDDKGIFIFKDFDFENGIIHRSRIKGYKSPNHSLYSSLIIDAYKM